jgi:upstream activation factor subunit UAF30
MAKAKKTKKATATKKGAAKSKVTTKKAAKTATKKAASKKAAPKKVTKPAKKSTAKKAKSGAKRKPNAAFMRPLQPSEHLAEIVGASPISRPQVVSKLWEYIRKNKLQDAKNRRNINADSKLKNVFGGKAQVSMFEMNKLVSKHLK